MTPKLYDLTELKELLKLEVRTLRKYIKQGKIPAVKIGRNWKVTDEGIQLFINNSKRNF